MAAAAGGLDKAPSHTLPPGDVQGQLIEADGVTPHGNVKVTLKEAESGDVVASTMADAEGKYTLRNVAVGSYVVYVGNPGLGALLQVQEGAKEGTLVIAIPKALSLPIPESWKEGGLFEESGAVIALAVGGVVICGGGAAYIEDQRSTTGELVEVSPIAPRNTLVNGLFFRQ